MANASTNNSEAKHYNVIVVGGGLSGLNTAYNLVYHHGFHKDKIAILEARDRVGGRTFSKEEKMYNSEETTRRDMGAEFVSPHQARLNAYIDQFGLEKATIYKSRRMSVFQHSDGIRTSWIQLPVGWHQFDAIRGNLAFSIACKDVNLDDVTESKNAAYWDNTTVAVWAAKQFTSEISRNFFLTMMTMAYGSPAEEMPMLHLMYFVKSTGGLLRLATSGDYHIVNGSQQVSEGLASELSESVLLNHPVHRITRIGGADGNLVEVAANHDGQEVILTADFVVVAVPTPFAAEKISFVPEFSEGRRELIKATKMENYVKVHVLGQSRIWDANWFLSAGISDVGPLCLFADGSYPKGQGDEGMIVGFLAGPLGKEWLKKPFEERKAAVKNQLRIMLGFTDQPEAFADCEYHEKSWADEKWSEGVTVVIEPGKFHLYGQYFTKPEGRIYFAGSETSNEWHGYMEGALASGERAANQINDALTHHNLVVDQFKNVATYVKHGLQAIHAVKAFNPDEHLDEDIAFFQKWESVLNLGGGEEQEEKKEWHTTDVVKCNDLSQPPITTSAEAFEEATKSALTPEVCTTDNDAHKHCILM